MKNGGTSSATGDKMIIKITGRHVEITDALREHVEQKIHHAATEWPNVGSVHVVLNLEKQTRCQAEVVLHADHHGLVEAKAESHDMYLSMDEAIEKADRQVRHWKEKLQHAHKAREALGTVDRKLQDRKG